MENREFLQLAHDFNPKKHRFCGWFMSEKRDGIRGFWDGGFTRGQPLESIPWANTEKHDRFVTKPTATGLWTRYGQPIQAPAWFLDQLPNFPLDGELYIGRRKWQETSSIVRTMIPDARWKNLRYHVFDSPSLSRVLADGRIYNPNFKKIMAGCLDYAIKLGVEVRDPESFQTTYARLLRELPETHDFIVLEPQRQLAFNTPKAQAEMDEFLAAVIDQGGEGIMLRNPMFLWTPKRVDHLLKFKPFNDAEGIVVGYTWGERTDLGSKLLGKMGALVVEWSGKRFRLSGFTDEERMMVDSRISDHSSALSAAYSEGCNHPGEMVVSEITNPRFPRGATVTFRYRELTQDGLPKEARYWRQYVGA